MKQFETKLELLQDTIDYYWGKPERRCAGETGECKYNPKSVGLEGVSEGCAIGRLLNQELKELLDEEYSGGGVSDESIYNLMPDWLKVFGQKFLVQLQILHDGKILSKKDIEGLKFRCINEDLNIDFKLLKLPE